MYIYDDIDQRLVDERVVSFHDFGEVYQAAADRPLPLFRRRISPAAA